MRLEEKRGMAALFITHDVGEAYYISDIAAVMMKGQIIETGSTEKVSFNPKHPYTKT